MLKKAFNVISIVPPLRLAKVANILAIVHHLLWGARLLVLIMKNSINLFKPLIKVRPVKLSTVNVKLKRKLLSVISNGTNASDNFYYAA